MALTTDATNAEAPARPTLAEAIRSHLPEHTHFASPWTRPDARPRPGSFNATWTTPAGTWSVAFSGPRSGDLIAAAFTGRPAPDPAVVVSGPTGSWTFPADAERTPEQVRGFLTVVGAIAERIPPAPRGFVYIGRADGDGLSFTTEGPIDPDAANLMAGRPVFGARS